MEFLFLIFVITILAFIDIASSPPEWHLNRFLGYGIFIIMLIVTWFYSIKNDK